MEVIIAKNSAEGSSIAARLVANLVRRKPNAVLGLATGATPLLLYQELVRLHREEGLDFGGVTTFNLDEYVGLPPSHSGSYYSYMKKNLLDHINVPPQGINVPDGLTADIPKFCGEYEARIKKAGGIDLQVLGIGADGHIGFNEPTSSLASRTRIKTLTVETLRDNGADFGGVANAPHHVITMGIGTILESRVCLLMAFGEKKAGVVALAVEGPLTSMVPASALQLHPSAKFILDEAAAAGLEKRSYYNYVYEHKPSWQCE